MFGTQPRAAGPDLSPEDQAQLKNGMDRLRFCIKHVSDDTVHGVFQILEDLKPLGENASSAVAGLLHELAARRDAGVRFILVGAAELPATPELVAEVRKVAKDKSVYHGEPSPHERTMTRDNLVLWTTTTNLVIRKYAEEYLAKLPGK
jgi:hypothetical protein